MEQGQPAWECEASAMPTLLCYSMKSKVFPTEPRERLLNIVGKAAPKNKIFRGIDRDD